MNRAIKYLEKLAKVAAYLAALLTLAMSCWITYDVLARNLFSIGSPWSFDLSEYSLVWITFLAAPWVLLRDGHVRIEIVVEALPLKLQKMVGILVSVIGVFVCGILTWQTSIAAVEYVQGGIMMPRIWHIPRIWPYIVVPIGSAMLTIAFLVRLFFYATDPDPERRLRAERGGHGGDSSNVSM